jgi:hypothetical protein
MTQVTQTEALELIAAYGSAPARWPQDRREAVLALAGTDPVVAGAQAEARALDALLGDWARDVAPRSFDVDVLVPVARVFGARPAVVTARGWRAPRWLAGGALAASVAVALLLGIGGQEQQFAVRDGGTPSPSLESASGQPESMDDFALVFTPTADEEDLI